jgi:DNA-binding IclR family transcriptional regulator
MTEKRARAHRSRDDAVWRTTLAALAERPLSAQEMARALGVKHAACTQRLRTLIQRGYATRSDDYHSTHRYVLTMAGHTLRQSEAPISMSKRTEPAADTVTAGMDSSALLSALNMGTAPARLTGRIVKPLNRRARA